jgi:hypothetical protein
MANTNNPTNRRAAYAVGGVTFVLLACWFIWGGSPPQMGADREVFRTVDALFTAITARDVQQLGLCEQRLTGYKESGKLSDDAWTYLDRVIRTARSGEWQSAAEKLYGFMKAQRRSG